MLVRVAVLADYASISEHAKLNVMGIFAVIFTPSAPYVHPQMQLVYQLEFEPAETGKKKIKIVLQDQDAKEIFSASGEIVVPRSAGGGPSVVNQILAFNNLTFRTFGPYEFLLLINDEIKAIIPLQVIRPPQMPLLTTNN